MKGSLTEDVLFGQTLHTGQLNNLLHHLRLAIVAGSDGTVDKSYIGDMQKSSTMWIASIYIYTSQTVLTPEPTL